MVNGWLILLLGCYLETFILMIIIQKLQSSIWMNKTLIGAVVFVHFPLNASGNHKHICTVPRNQTFPPSLSSCYTVMKISLNYITSYQNFSLLLFPFKYQQLHQIAVLLSLGLWIKLMFFSTLRMSSIFLLYNTILAIKVWHIKYYTQQIHISKLFCLFFRF